VNNKPLVDFAPSVELIQKILDENALLIATISQQLLVAPDEAYLFQQRLHNNLRLVHNMMNLNSAAVENRT